MCAPGPLSRGCGTCTNDESQRRPLPDVVVVDNASAGHVSTCKNQDVHGAALAISCGSLLNLKFLKRLPPLYGIIDDLIRIDDLIQGTFLEAVRRSTGFQKDLRLRFELDPAKPRSEQHG